MEQEKQLEIERKTRYKDNLGREIALFKEQLPDVVMRLEIHLQSVALLTRNQEIAMANFKFRDPKWDYEAVPEYIENIRSLNILNFKKASIDWKTQETQMRGTVESINAQLESAATELAKVTKELEELKGDSNGN